MSARDKTMDVKPQADEHRKPRRTVAVGSKGSAPKSKAETRRGRGTQSRLPQAQDERKRLAELEAQMEIDDERHEALVTLMADETLCRPGACEAAMTEYNELKARMTASEAEWLRALRHHRARTQADGEDA